MTLPPLRERPDDIALLVAHFTNLIAPSLGVPRWRSIRRTLARMADYDWPGNVRELRNLVERSLILGWFDIGPEPKSTMRSMRHPAPMKLWKPWKSAISWPCWPPAKATSRKPSRRLGISRKTMDRKCQAWGLLILPARRSIRTRLLPPGAGARSAWYCR
ncbi:MAG: hypothetical protein MZW92_08180 [Comamonadaceae bacterium]|nr:hypothetical protein [Comamonadaceae bacterium]